MKKILLSLLLFTLGFTITSQIFKADEVGDVVVHFHKWDGEYAGIGAHAWGGPASPTAKPKGEDDFGIFFEFKNIPVGTEVGFIAVYFNDENDNSSQNWDKKLTGDVKFTAVKAGETVHVYVFEGAETTEDDPGYFVVKNDKYNLIIVYADPSGNYEDTLGVHSWNWDEDYNAVDYTVPLEIFSNGASHSSIPNIKVGILYSSTDEGGLLIYAGNDDNKKTGNVTFKDVAGENAAIGSVGIAYVVNAGDGYTKNDNVYYDAEVFAEEAFSFRLLPMTIEPSTREISGTYASDPKTVMVNVSSPVASPNLVMADKEAAKDLIMSWFTVREILTETTYGSPLEIEDVHYASTAETLTNFVLILKNDLDNAKRYEVSFDSSLTEKNFTLVFNVTLDKALEEGEFITIPGGFSGWNPESADFKMTKVSDLKYKFEFAAKIDEDVAYFTTEYKYTQGGWDSEERVEGNRTVVVTRDDIVNGKFEINDTVTFDEDKDKVVPKKYAEPFKQTSVSASLELDLDTEAPEISFISPTSIVGKDEAERIIQVPWGKEFNMNLFPRFEATDNRDGDITGLVFVPKGDFSKIDTSIEGDYVIMLEVSDHWGNTTQVKFTFRVAKGK